MRTAPQTQRTGPSVHRNRDGTEMVIQAGLKAVSAVMASGYGKCHSAQPAEHPDLQATHVGVPFVSPLCVPSNECGCPLCGFCPACGCPLCGRLSNECGWPRLHAVARGGVSRWQNGRARLRPTESSGWDGLGSFVPQLRGSTRLNRLGGPEQDARDSTTAV